MSNAKEALALHLYSMEEDGEEIPAPSDPGKLEPVEGGFYTLIEVRTGLIRDKQLNRSVTKNVTLPRWLELEATKAGLNYSQILQTRIERGIRDCQ
ncbi:type II toxin-antitoxin system HicB family antitoxin [Paenibacillus hamazuiensis]|uniref:type II toxin-antitoxin system HicB family antitoxin n=1 Tax=Paenibacillus hamazuiensis TaxID=2936508 RepID=UPI00200FA32B|nr:type II toxin-antitoxin system HicB family antitoxin [Paenibacillus hamazuiensis]